MPKRTVQETIEYFELLAREFAKKSHREQDELAKAQYAAKAEAYELAAGELKRNCDYSPPRAAPEPHGSQPFSMPGPGSTV